MNNYIENELSQKIYQKMHSNNKEEQEVMVAPATLALIARITISVIKAIKACKESSEDRENIIRNPSSADEDTLKRIVRKKLGWWKYFLIGGKVIKSIKETGKEVAHNDLNQAGLFDDASHTGKSGRFEDGTQYYEL